MDFTKILSLINKIILIFDIPKEIFMKKIVLISLLMLSAAFSQLRFGIDASRTMEMKLKFLGMEETESGNPDGMGLTFGYEQMLLLGLIGVGAEYTLSTGGEDDDHDHDHDHDDEDIELGNPGNFAFVYAVSKVPVGFPMVRGIVRAGTTLGHSEEGLKGGLSYGFGLRFKPPILPVGVEAHYTMHNFDLDFEGDIPGIESSVKYSSINLTATYKF
tara:strand:- start:33 stop:680 length:648 start_codon:yes stop_codon:yes gene_type:complete